MATKKKRPPRQVWLRVLADGEIVRAFRTKKEADDDTLRDAYAETVGPYVLAERVRQK